jgi:choline kinase
MKVVILAAGKGSRLGGNHLPKPLARLASGKTILGHQLESLSHYVSMDSILIVVGYHKEEIMEQFPGFLFVYNPNFAQENTAKSLLKALNKIEDDVLWINGDVVFHHSIIASILNISKTSMVVNVGPVGEEEVKYRQDQLGCITEVSKTVLHPRGEALGINYCSEDDLVQFRASLEHCAEHDYFERGLELCIQQGMSVWSIPVETHLCTEIDFPQDLERADILIQKWTKMGLSHS